MHSRSFSTSASMALAFSASGVMHDARRLTVEKFSIDHADVAQVLGGARVDLDQERPLRSLDMQLVSLRFPGVYESYLQPLLLDTGFKSMTTAGGVAGRLQIEQGEPASIDLTFDDVTLDDGAGNFALAGLTGRWSWRAGQTKHADDGDDWARDGSGAAESSVRWRGGLLLGLEIGRGDLRFSTTDRQFRLLQPARIPVLDGALDLTTLRIRGVGSPKAAFMVDAVLQPISVQRLCKHSGGRSSGAGRRRDFETADARGCDHARNDAAGARVRRLGHDQRPATRTTLWTVAKVSNRRSPSRVSISNSSRAPSRLDESPVGSLGGSMNCSSSTGLPSPSTRTSTRPPAIVRDIASVNAQSKTSAALAGVERASPRRCRAASCVSSTTSTMTGWDGRATLRTRFAA